MVAQMVACSSILYGTISPYTPFEGSNCSRIPSLDGRTVWNEELIDDIFWAEEALVVKNIPIGRSMRGDTRIWGLTEKWVFLG